MSISFQNRLISPPPLIPSSLPFPHLIPSSLHPPHLLIPISSPQLSISLSSLHPPLNPSSLHVHLPLISSSLHPPPHPLISPSPSHPLILSTPLSSPHLSILSPHLFIPCLIPSSLCHPVTHQPTGHHQVFNGLVPPMPVVSTNSVAVAMTSIVQWLTSLL